MNHDSQHKTMLTYKQFGLLYAILKTTLLTSAEQGASLQQALKGKTLPLNYHCLFQHHPDGFQRTSTQVHAQPHPPSRDPTA